MARMDFRRPLRTVTPTLDGDVLAVLARADAQFTGRHVHRLVGHSSERGVRDALERLVRQGVVHSERVGGSKLYHLNRAHLAAEWVIGLANLRAHLLERLESTIASWTVRPAAAVLFGSVARGEADEDSDLDLLVVRPRGTAPDHPQWEDQLADLQYSGTAWTGNDARVLEYGEAEILDGEVSRDPALVEALRDGIPLHGDVRRLKRTPPGPDERA
jgi:predicted nucleotidyltransferase